MYILWHDVTNTETLLSTYIATCWLQAEPARVYTVVSGQWSGQNSSDFFHRQNDGNISVIIYSNICSMITFVEMVSPSPTSIHIYDIHK